MSIRDKMRDPVRVPKGTAEDAVQADPVKPTVADARSFVPQDAPRVKEPKGTVRSPRQPRANTVRRVRPENPEKYEKLLTLCRGSGVEQFWI